MQPIEYEHLDISIEIGFANSDDVDDRPELKVGGKSVPYGQFPDGTYFLYENAYEWSDNLAELAERLVERRAQNVKDRRTSSDEGE